jgi:hypothetical protein
MLKSTPLTEKKTSGKEKSWDITGLRIEMEPCAD